MDLVSWWSALAPAVQVSSIALLVAIGAGVVGVVGAVNGARGLKLARKQEANRRLPLVVQHLESSYLVEAGTRRFEIELSVRNPSDIGNSLSSVELEVVYTTSASSKPISLLLSPSKALAHSPLIVPTTIGGKATVQGTVAFAIEEPAFVGKSINRYALRTYDTDRRELVTDIQLISPRRGA